MDANGLRFWLLADAAHWPSRAHTAWHAECGTLRLASERRLTAPVDLTAFAAANTALEAIPRAVDIHDGVARWSGGAGAIVVRSHLPGDALRLPLPEAPSDLCGRTERRAVCGALRSCAPARPAGPLGRRGGTARRIRALAASRRTAAACGCSSAPAVSRG